MNDWEHLVLPPAAADILRETIAVRFINAIDQLTGALLRTLAASKPGGRLLELGTGTGLGTAWLLDGMDAEARLTTVEVNPSTSGIAQRYLGHDPRVEFIVSDAEQFLAHLGNRHFDLIFADCPVGKGQNLDTVLSALAPGGLYIIDDMLPHTYTPERVPMQKAVVEMLSQRKDLHLTKLSWSTGIVMATKRA